MLRKMKNKISILLAPIIGATTTLAAELKDNIDPLETLDKGVSIGQKIFGYFIDALMYLSIAATLYYLYVAIKNQDDRKKSWISFGAALGGFLLFLGIKAYFIK